MHFPLRALWDVGGHSTESLLWPAKKQEKKVVLFFIPGNPGLVEYYTPFLQRIYENVQSPHFEVIGVSHQGHSTNYSTNMNSDQKLYSLEDQIQHKVECFDTIMKENSSNTKVILIGHSIGAYIAAEVLKKRPNHGIKRVIALFPTLRDISVTPNGIYISKLVKWTPNFAIRVVGSFLSWLAPPLRQFVVKTITRQSGNSLAVTAHQLLNSYVLQNVITLAHFEMDAVKDLDHEFYNEHLEKFIIYYSENDKWAPKDHYDYMVKNFEKGDIHLCELNIPHAFCLDTGHVSYMAGKVGFWIQEHIYTDTQ